MTIDPERITHSPLKASVQYLERADRDIPHFRILKRGNAASFRRHACRLLFAGAADPFKFACIEFRDR